MQHSHSESDGDSESRTAYIIVGTAVVLGVVSVVLIPIVAPAVLGVVGFGPLGPVAGTAAAGIQAGIGNVAAGSLFAGAQSVAMGGAVPAIGYAIGVSIASGLGALAAKPACLGIPNLAAFVPLCTLAFYLDHGRPLPMLMASGPTLDSAVDSLSLRGVPRPGS